jgi:peptidyl-prolyl cis-trans isomerase C
VYKRQEPEQRANLVRQVLLTKAVAAKARKEGFDRKPDVKEQLSYLIDNFLAQEYVAKVVTANVVVPDEELKKYYAEHEKDFVVPEAAKVRHILVAADKDAAPEVKEKARLKAEALLQQLKKGEDFAKVARESSDDADSAPKGGELGYISPGKTNSEELEKAIFALKAGEMSPVVETPFGFHIIKVEERKEKRTATFDEAKEYMTGILKSQLEQKKAQEFLEKVTKDSGIEVLLDKPAEPKEPAKQ